MEKFITVVDLHGKKVLFARSEFVSFEFYNTLMNADEYDDEALPEPACALSIFLKGDIKHTFLYVTPDELDRVILALTGEKSGL